MDGDGADEDLESVLSDIKSHPGNVSLNSLLDEISKLKQVRAVSTPAKAFTGIGVQVINAWRARASAAAPSHLCRFSPEVRHVLLAALLFQRQREITDTLVELLNSTVHRINARAEKKVTEAFVAEFTKVHGKSGLLGKIAAASLGASSSRAACGHSGARTRPTSTAMTISPPTWAASASPAPSSTNASSLTVRGRRRAGPGCGPRTGARPATVNRMVLPAGPASRIEAARSLTGRGGAPQPRF